MPTLLGLANRAAVTEAGDGIQFLVQCLDGVDGVHGLLARLTQSGVESDPERPLPVEACKPYFAVRRSIWNDTG